MGIKDTLSKEDTLRLKGIAICGMLCWHVFFCENPLGVVFPSFIRFIGIIGDSCVSIFLYLSGYGLAISFCKYDRSIIGGVKYLIGRFIKFYFNFWFIFLIFVPIGIYLFKIQMPAGDTPQKTFITWSCQILGLSGHQSYNSTWWFNTLIIELYFLFPILYKISSKHPIPLLAITLLLSIVSLKIKYLLVFETGILSFMYKEYIRKTLCKVEKRKALLVIAFLFVITIVLLWFLGEDAIYNRGMYCFLTISILLHILSSLMVSNDNFLCHILYYLGKHSANIYLIHTFFFYYWFPNFFISMKHPLVIWGILIALSFITSIAIEHMKAILGWNKISAYLLHKVNCKF